MFLLMFLLIGINPVDLYNAEKPQRGRLNYTRRKTQKPYSIKIEPETDALIRKYAGEKYMLNIKERFGNYKTYFRRLNRSLCKIGKEVRPGEKSQGEASVEMRSIFTSLPYAVGEEPSRRVAGAKRSCQDSIPEQHGHRGLQ